MFPVNSLDPGSDIMPVHSMNHTHTEYRGRQSMGLSVTVHVVPRREVVFSGGSATGVSQCLLWNRCGGNYDKNIHFYSILSVE